VINNTGNFLNRILELFSMVDTVSAPSMSGILKLAIILTIDILTIFSKQMNNYMFLNQESDLLIHLVQCQKRTQKLTVVCLERL
jgi:hypothetical protein